MLPHDTFTDVVYPVGSNYIFALIDLNFLVTRLMDEETPLNASDAITLGLTAISTAEMLVFSYLPSDVLHIASKATGLCLAAYAFKLLIDSITQTIDLVKATNKLSFEGWLENALIELNHLEMSIAKKQLEKYRLEELRSHKDIGNNHLKRWNAKLKKLTPELRMLEEKHKILLGDIEARSTVYASQGENSNPHDNNTYTSIAETEKRLATISTIERKVGRKNVIENLIYSNNNQQDDYDDVPTPSPAQMARAKAIELKCKDEVKSKAIQLGITLTSCIGYSFIAAAVFCPPLFVPGVILAGIGTIAGGIFFTKKMMDTASDGPRLSTNSNSFFRINTKNKNNAELRPYAAATLAARM